MFVHNSFVLYNSDMYIHYILLLMLGVLCCFALLFV